MYSGLILHDEGWYSYLKKIEKFPLLSELEEKELATLWINNKDLSAAHQLVTSHLRLVAKIAFQFRNYGFSLMELVAEGTVGLMKAVKNFKLEAGCRVSTYAIWWIKSAIQDYILKSWSLVKIGTTSAQRKLFYNLKKLQKRSMGNKQIAEELSVAESEVEEMGQVLAGREYSLSHDANSDNHFSDLMASKDSNQEVIYADNQEKSYQKKLLWEAMQSLDDRYKNIVIERKLQDKPTTLEVLSKKYKISCERIRQIEAQAMKKIKKFISDKIGEVL